MDGQAARLRVCCWWATGRCGNRLKPSRERQALIDRVHFAGWRADVPAILAASSLLVLPSAWEGMPNVVLEAMAGRLPVVASDVEGVRELLGPNAEKQTIRYNETAAFVDRLVGLMSDPTLAQSVGIENRRRAEEHFDIARMVRRYEDFWASLIASRK